MTVDREQIRRDAEIELSGQSFRSSTGAARSLATDCLALLAELEQAERERDGYIRDFLAAGERVDRREQELGEAQAGIEARDRALAENAEWERRTSLALERAEAQLAKVPALVEALRVCHDDLLRWAPAHWRNQGRGEILARDALAAWENTCR